MNTEETEKDIVLSSRIRLARNIKGYKFTTKWTEKDKVELESRIYREFRENPLYENYSIYNINELDELDRIVLKEKKIISERYYRQGNGLVITDEDQNVSFVTGDLDHLRISAVIDGLSINEAFAKTSFIDKDLSKHFEFASKEKKGYLTVNVADSGTAMKGSVFLHLPVLCASELMDNYIINTIETMLEVTGFSGGGAHSLGGFYIISNKNGFFPDEFYLAELLNKTAKMFIDSEREVREELINGKYPGLEDSVYRSLGILKYCRQISEQEALSTLSMVRLGVSVNWLDDMTLDDISSVLSKIGNGSLRSFAYENNPDETDIMRLRAETIRKHLHIEI
ncbi:MAG: hypothetical protein PF518_12450 [Spirochaetaceae bacterium]|jgi:protein arginine kinase|nr:hypothetical protein [Spirochaetaceae bacterium]